jgi:MATE family multidrug resistance protein
MLFLGNLGDINQAASNLAFQITMFNFMPTIGIGIAISILVGQSMGSNKIELAQTYIRYGRNITLVYTCTFAALYVIIPEMFIFPFEVGSNDPNFPEIYQKTKTLLLFLAAFSIADGLQIIYASALKGAGDTHFVMKFLSLTSIFVLILPTYYLVNIANWSLNPLWAWLSGYIMILALGYHQRLKSGKWKSINILNKVN